MEQRSGAAERAGTTARKPFYNEDAERGVLGAILLDAGRVLDFCIEKQIGVDSFYLRAHQLVFATLLDMARDGRPIDALTVSDRLTVQGLAEEVGGLPALNRLIDSIPTAAHAEYYIDLVRQNHLLRRIVACARDAENECYTSDDEADVVLGRVEQSFFGIAEQRHDLMAPWREAVVATMATIDRILETRRGISGIATGYADLDRKILGLHDGEMIVLAARPSMGKTSLAMNIAEQVALGGHDQPPRAVAIFSLEMTREQLIMRLLCSHARIAFHRIASGMLTDLDHGRLTQAAATLMKASLFLDDTGGLDILELRARARRLKKKHDIGLFVIDYLQLLHNKDRVREGRQMEIASISGSIKAMAKELKVPVLVLSQLNRTPETRDRSGKARLADLRDSGSIEQDADVVMLLRRPALYADDTEEKIEEPNLALLDVAKQRNGPTGEIKLTFLGDIMRFENYAPPYPAAGEAAPAEARP